MKREVILSLLLISVLLVSGASGCGSTSSPSSTSNDNAQRSSSRNGVYSGSIIFTADEITGYPRPNSQGATGATKHLSTTINFSGYQVGADEQSKNWEVPVNGTYDYSCATAGNYIPQYKDSFPSSASFSGVLSTAPAPTMGASKGLENGVTLNFDYSNQAYIAVEPTMCEGASGGATTLINVVLRDIFSKYYGNTDKLTGENGYATYYFNKDGETVSFGRTFEKDPAAAAAGWTDTYAYSGTVTVVKDK